MVDTILNYMLLKMRLYGIYLQYLQYMHCLKVLTPKLTKLLWNVCLQKVFGRIFHQLNVKWFWKVEEQTSEFSF